MSGTPSGLTFEDAWDLWHEFEQHHSCRLECEIFAPRTTKQGSRYPAHVAVRTSRTVKGTEKSVGALCQIGGARGARTVPAALVRALTELSAKLEAQTENAARQAAF